MVLTCRFTCGNIITWGGGMSEWFKESVLKTDDSERNQGFESLSLLQEKYSSGRRDTPAKGAGRLEAGARVRISPSPPFFYFLERCPSGLRSTTGNRVNFKKVSGVRIPISPPSWIQSRVLWMFFC